MGSADEQMMSDGPVPTAGSGQGCTGASFDDFYRRSYVEIYRFARAFYLEVDSIDDVIQDSYLRLFVKWPALDTDDNAAVVAYLKRAVRNRIVDLSRQRSVREKALQSFLFFKESAAGADDEVIDVREVLMLMRHLPPAQRTALTLYADGLDKAEISEILQITERTVNSNIRHARRRLQKLLVKYLPSLAASLQRGSRS